MIKNTINKKRYLSNKKAEISFSYEAITTIVCILLIGIIMFFINSGILDIQKASSASKLSSGDGLEISYVKTFLNLPLKINSKDMKMKDLIISTQFDTTNNKYSFEDEFDAQKDEYLNALGITDKTTYLNWRILDASSIDLDYNLDSKNFCQPILLKNVDDKFFVLCYREVI